ncbi:methyl-accepting chemotaxis protein [Pyxidicoccus fallax]|uniref:Methyl-accepting chemotaxis protein n=1 Tax=Pyxidicoccus fallax TaxID=394095 RepID=A0A848LW32_9BACT|nr:methyl-accepting chemotaxis protein [Pyxidicoccus fallax]NPC83991.1 methyl-accepting chemotaxis protein [Pyxidicoccus fallax]
MKLKLMQKMMAVPAVAAVFLVSILVVFVTLGVMSGKVYERINSSHVPTIELSREMHLRYPGLHRGVMAEVNRKAEGGLEPLRTEVTELQEKLDQARTVPGANVERTDTLKADLAAYWRNAEAALALAVKGDAGAEAARAKLESSFQALNTALKQAAEDDARNIAISYDEVKGLHITMQVLVTVLVLLGIALTVGLALWVHREVTVPLGKLTSVATRIAQEGDLSQPIDASSQDEVGELARGFQVMVTRLRDVPNTISSVVADLSAAAGRLTQASQDQVTFLTNQSRSLTEASTTIAEIAQTSNMAASRAEMVLKVAAQADAFSASGQQSIEKSAEGLQQIRQRVGALVGSIGHLSDQAVHAGEIISSVKDLADQSNVLALNAAIEAARAGEEGRGFAVVAREMRSLSGQSLQSTQRIGKILLEINQAIRSTVSIAEGDSQKMEEGIEQVLASANTLREITTVVQESSQAARQIVASVTQQNAGIAQMTEVMTQLSAMMADVVTATMTAEEAVTQINASLGQLTELSTSFRA